MQTVIKIMYKLLKNYKTLIQTIIQIGVDA